MSADRPLLPDTAPGTSSYPYRLMAPGPVPVHPEVLEVLSQPPLHHRTPEFEKILRHTLDRLKKVFQTTQPVFTLSTTGTGAMEAALVNTLSPGDPVLILESGKFGQRWCHLASQFQLSLDVVETAWGYPYQVADVEAALQKKKYKAVLATACETSTGVLHPIREIGSLLRDEEETLFIVDGITAVGATPLPMDDWGIDVLVAGSQKAFMLPTGLSLIALSEPAWKMNAQARCPRMYLDLAAERKANTKGETRWSSNVTLINALNRALDIMLSDGLSQHFKRIHTLAKATRKAAMELKLGIFSQATSPSLTALLLPTEVDGQKVRLHLEENYNITIAGGQDQLRGKILRIGHMGYITDEDAIETLRGLGRSLHALYPLMFSEELADRAAVTLEKELHENSGS